MFLPFLPWLPVTHRIDYKLSCLDFSGVSGMCLEDLSELINICTLLVDFAQLLVSEEIVLNPFIQN